MKSKKALGIVAAAAMAAFGVRGAMATTITEWTWTAKQAAPVNSPRP